MGSRRLVGAGRMRRFSGVSTGAGTSAGGLPVNLVAPVASGVAEIGQTLSVTTGVWMGSPTFTYQWQRDGVNIASATANTYATTRDDSDTDVTCVVTATNASGSRTATSNAIVIPTLEAQIIARYTGASWTAQYVFLARAGDVDGASVGTWTDRSGTGGDATQGTAGAKPAFSATSLNSQGGITFDGGDLLATATRDLSSQTAAVLHAVFKDTTGSVSIVAERSVSTGGNNGGLYLSVNESAGTVRHQGHANGLNTSANSNTRDMVNAHVITGTWDQALTTDEAAIRIDGADDTASRPANGNTSGGLGNHATFIGARSGISLGLAGTIGAVIFATGTTGIPATAVAGVENILKTHWGTP